MKDINEAFGMGYLMGRQDERSSMRKNLIELIFTVVAATITIGLASICVYILNVSNP